jgi:ribosomal protein L37E
MIARRKSRKTSQRHENVGSVLLLVCTQCTRDFLLRGTINGSACGFPRKKQIRFILCGSLNQPPIPMEAPP